MSEDSQATIGQVLRDAREKQGISVDEAAMRLRLMHRQIDAMEADDFASLGQPVFARGFVRNYARLLGLVPEELLARMEGAPAEPAPATHAEPPLPRSWLSSPWLILVVLVLLLVVAVPVGLYLWLNSDVEDASPKTAPSAARSPSAPVAAHVKALPAAEPPAAPLVSVEPTVPEAVKIEPTGAGVPAVSSPVTSVASGEIHMEFGDESWVEIKDSSGHVLQRQLHPAGAKVDIQGRPPFDMLIGNAAQVRMTYNGRPVDLKPFIAVSVARFTLEE
jgi:cytoskeleton protein RodZ